jgi:hypothetical protein
MKSAVLSSEVSMTRTFRFVALLGLLLLAGLAQPSAVYAQRHGPSGGGRTGVAVPRTYHVPASQPYFRGPYYRPYYYRPYYYPWYAYRPYYYSPWYFSFGLGLGWGAYAPSYAYPYPYAYPYSSPAPYEYSSPYPAEYQVQTLPPASRTNEPRELGTLSVRVSPADAAILIDGEPWERPRGDDRFSIDLPEGPHRLEVRKEGYGFYTRTMDILPGRTITWNVSLTSGGSTQTVRPMR